MSTLNTARDRAEELLQSLQKRARELLDADAGMVKTVRTLVEERGLSPNRVWARVKASGAAVVLNDYRGEVERRLGVSVEKLLASLPASTVNDVEAILKQVPLVGKKISEFTQKRNSTAGTDQKVS